MLQIGDTAPDFTINDTNNSPVSLSSFKGEKNVLLLFFPFAFSSTCTEELCSTRDNLKIYESLDAQVFGISIDSFFTLKEYKASHNLNFPLLSDFNKDVSTAYNTLYEEFIGMKGVSKRSAFLINKEGVIKYTEILDNASEIPNFDAINEALQAL